MSIDRNLRKRISKVVRDTRKQWRIINTLRERVSMLEHSMQRVGIHVGWKTTATQISNFPLVIEEALDTTEKSQVIGPVGSKWRADSIEEALKEHTSGLTEEEAPIPADFREVYEKNKRERVLEVLSTPSKEQPLPEFIPTVHKVLPLKEWKEPTLKYFKTRDVKDPVRGTPLSAGIDFFIPSHQALIKMSPEEFNKAHWSKVVYWHKNEATGEVTKRPMIEIPPFGSTLIPSGLKVDIPAGFALIAFNKSGIATKKGLIIGACVVDEDYQGEVHLHLINPSDNTVLLQPGDKIAQFILVPMAYLELEEVYEIHQEETERGSGGFGSTGDR